MQAPLRTEPLAEMEKVLTDMTDWLQIAIGVGPPGGLREAFVDADKRSKQALKDIKNEMTKVVNVLDALGPYCAAKVYFCHSRYPFYLYIF